MSRAVERAASHSEGRPVFRRAESGRVWLLGGLLLAGTALRIAPLTDNRFHPDEALYAALARLIASGRDPLLAHTALLVDKPPLFYLLLAGGVWLWGSGELAARLPALFASLISVALAARLAWQLWRSAAAAGLAGALAGLAAATKQTGLICLPLAVALGVVRSASARLTWREALGWAWPFALGLGSAAALTFGWDALRGPTASFWQAGAAANDPGRLARSAEVWPRAAGWLGLLRGMTASNAANLLVLAGIGGMVPLEIGRRTRGAAATLTLLAFAGGYAALLWLVAFPVLDRYLLPLVAILALLGGRGLSLLADGLPARSRLRRSAPGWLAGLALAVLLARPAWQAAHNAYPLGGDHGAYDGVDAVAAALRALPEGSVVYYDSLGWSLGYYLFDAPLHLASFDSPAALAADLAAFGRDGTARALVLPGWEGHAEVIRAVAGAGFRAEVMLEVADRRGERSFVVYRLTAAGDHDARTPG